SDKNGTAADGVAFKVSAAPAGTTITLAGDPTGKIVAGDRVLLADMQRTATDFSAVGRWELLTVTGTSSSTLTVAIPVANSYAGASFANKKMTVQRVRQYRDLSLGSGGKRTASAGDGLAAPSWNQPVATGL